MVQMAAPARTKRMVALDAEEQLALDADGGCRVGAIVICGCDRWPSLSPVTREQLTQQARLAAIRVFRVLALLGMETQNVHAHVYTRVHGC